MVQHLSSEEGYGFNDVWVGKQEEREKKKPT
jgi:hypothetical protein